jgi:UDP-3-O-[3-hydroxymyristoyl] glucosamine N-acyltransferase
LAASHDELVGVRLDAPRRVAELSLEHGGTLDEGLADAVVSRIVPPEYAKYDDDLVVATSALGAARATAGPGVVLSQSSVSERVAVGRRWVHTHVTWVLAHLLAPMAEREAPQGVDRSAWIHPAAFVDGTAVVRPGAIILADARIGPHTVIGEGAVICRRARLGARVVVGPLAVVGRPGFGWATGPSGEVIRIPQLGGVVVEDDVEIGPLCTIDGGTLSPTILRRGVRLDAHVHVAHNVEIGEGTLVAAQAGFAGSVRVGPGALVGGQAGITDHAIIGAGARIAAKSGVIGDVGAGSVVAGYPAIPRGRWLRIWARLLSAKRRSRK